MAFEPQWIRRSEEILDNLAVSAVRLYLEAGLAPKEVYARMVNDGQDVRGERDVLRLIHRARSPERPLVRIKVEAADADTPLDQDLGDRLRRASGIQEVLVMSTELAGDQDYASTVESTQKKAFEENDELHRRLGHVAARFIWDHLRTGDAIALGGGRTTAFAVQALDQLSQWEAKNFANIKVVSLTGTVPVRPWASSSPSFHADAVAAKMAKILGVAHQDLKLTLLPVALLNPGAAIESVAPHLRPDGEWEDTPDLLLAGVGVLNTGHHLLHYDGPQIQAIQEEIRIIRDEKLDTPQTSIAEIFYNYFFVGNGLPIPEEVKQRTSEIIDRLNSKSVATSFGKLNKAREKMFVGGGAQKYDAILAVVKKKIDFRPTVFVTDSITANRLLRDISR